MWWQFPPARIFDVDLTKAACLQHKSLAGKEFGERLEYGKQQQSSNMKVGESNYSFPTGEERGWCMASSSFPPQKA